MLNWWWKFWIRQKDPGFWPDPDPHQCIFIIFSPSVAFPPIKYSEVRLPHFNWCFLVSHIFDFRLFCEYSGCLDFVPYFAEICKQKWKNFDKPKVGNFFYLFLLVFFVCSFNFLRKVCEKVCKNFAKYCTGKTWWPPYSDMMCTGILPVTHKFGGILFTTKLRENCAVIFREIPNKHCRISYFAKLNHLTSSVPV
jgi:hypothetical protein